MVQTNTRKLIACSVSKHRGLSLQIVHSTVALLTFVMIVVAIEYTIFWNDLGNVYSIKSTGQMIPFLIGVATLSRVIWKYFWPSKIDHDYTLPFKIDDSAAMCPAQGAPRPDSAHQVEMRPFLVDNAAVYPLAVGSPATSGPSDQARTRPFRIDSSAALPQAPGSAPSFPPGSQQDNARRFRVDNIAAVSGYSGYNMPRPNPPWQFSVQDSASVSYENAYFGQSSDSGGTSGRNY